MTSARRPFFDRIRTAGAAAGLVTSSMFLPACYPRSPAFAIFSTAVITAAVVSSLRPPPPRVVYVPAPRPGYAWQAGYWMRENDEWVWVEGRWIQLPPHYRWAPTHWEQAPDDTWHLIPGHWVPIRPGDQGPPEEQQPPPQQQ